jgi:hypothetical protein
MACARPASQGGARQDLTAEQQHFAVEGEPVKNPATIPDPILRLLAQDKDVQRVLSSQNLSPDQLPKSWFLASLIHLGNPEERNIVVVGQSYLVGANVATFWIFRQNREQYAAVFKAAAHDLEILTARTHGYRDIRTMASSSDRIFTQVFEFDGEKYGVARSTSDPIR